MEQLQVFHDWLMVFLIAILAGSLLALMMVYTSTLSHRCLVEAQTVENI